MGVRERLVCRSCYQRAGLDGEETTLGILVPMMCTICGREVPPTELHQPKHHYEQIRERLSAKPCARYGRSLDAALRSAKQAYAVISVAIENFMGERRGETVEERLARAVARARRTPSVDLGDFTHHVDDEEP